MVLSVVLESAPGNFQLRKIPQHTGTEWLSTSLRNFAMFGPKDALASFYRTVQVPVFTIRWQTAWGQINTSSDHSLSANLNFGSYTESIATKKLRRSQRRLRRSCFLIFIGFRCALVWDNDVTFGTERPDISWVFWMPQSTELCLVGNLLVQTNFQRFEHRHLSIFYRIPLGACA